MTAPAEAEQGLLSSSELEELTHEPCLLPDPRGAFDEGEHWAPLLHGRRARVGAPSSGSVRPMIIGGVSALQPGEPVNGEVVVVVGARELREDLLRRRSRCRFSAEEADAEAVEV